MELNPSNGSPSLKNIPGHIGSATLFPGPDFNMSYCWKDPESGIDIPSMKSPNWPQISVLILWVNAATFPKINIFFNE